MTPAEIEKLELALDNAVRAADVRSARAIFRSALAAQQGRVEQAIRFALGWAEDAISDAGGDNCEYHKDVIRQIDPEEVLAEWNKQNAAAPQGRQEASVSGPKGNASNPATAVASNQYRKRPVVIEAVQWAAVGDHPLVTRYADTCSVKRHDLCPQCRASLLDHGLCPTLEGSHIVCPGDWIITGIKGEHYPCKPDIFEATYELVGAAAPPAEDELPTDEQRGLYRKYRVERLNDAIGKHANCDYYVLDLVHDEFAWPALSAYAHACKEKFPELAKDLWSMVGTRSPVASPAAPSPAFLDGRQGLIKPKLYGEKK